MTEIALKIGFFVGCLLLIPIIIVGRFERD